MPEIHELKTNKAYWWAVDSGEKNFEVRRDDRGFQRGDVLRLLCWDNEGPKFAYMKNSAEHTSNAADAMFLERRVTWILTGGQHGIEAGYVVMGLAEVDEEAGG